MPVETLIPFNCVPLGLVGFSQLQLSGGKTYQLRNKTCNLIESQEVTKQNTIFTNYDRNVFQVQPKIIEGDIEFPVVLRPISTYVADSNLGLLPAYPFTPVQELWNLAVNRNNYNRLTSFNTNVYYYNNDTSFNFGRCFIDTFTFSVAQKSEISIKINVKAMDVLKRVPTEYITQNSRIAQWSDAAVLLWTPQFQITTAQIRSFNVNVSNNLERYFTASSVRVMECQDISPKARDISGTVVLVGKDPNLAMYSRDRAARCNEYATIEFGYSGCNDSFSLDSSFPTGSFTGVLPNVIFQYEEIGLTNDIFESTIKWFSLPANNSVFALSKGIFNSYVSNY